MEQTLFDKRLKKLVNDISPHSRLVRAWPLEGGISAQMTALEIEDPAGQMMRVILRCPGEAAYRHNPQAVEDEYRLLQVTHSMGLATPRPIYLDQKGAINNNPCLVIEYIAGGAQFSLANLDDTTRQMAAHLAKIHGVDGGRNDLAFLPPAAKGFVETLKNWPVSQGHSVEEGQIRDWLEAHWPIPQLNTRVLLHGDYWPGNVLWREGQLAAVIDWEDAAVGDPLMDLAIARLDLLWIFGREAMDAFTNHYLSVSLVDTTHLPAWDLYSALRLIRLAGADLSGWAGFFHPYGRVDITPNTIRDHLHWFVNQAFQTMEAR